jgi:hypothetical protein
VIDNGVFEIFRQAIIGFKVIAEDCRARFNVLTNLGNN